MTYSPTPWKLDKFYNIIDANGNAIVIDDVGRDAENEIDHTFIVTACNAYEANQDRIRQLEDALRAIADNEFYSNENGSIEDAKEFARRALGESK